MLYCFMSSTSRSISARATARPLTGEASWRFTPLNFTGFPFTWSAPFGISSVFMNPTFAARMSGARRGWAGWVWRTSV
mgnify:CR=1 FL=1